MKWSSHLKVLPKGNASLERSWPARSAERGVALSREQVWRLITGVPERLSLATLAALCDILGCGPGDLVEPVAGGRRAAEPAATAYIAGTAR
jgi:DNA-binding Xre family transcriptional regulator